MKLLKLKTSIFTKIFTKILTQVLIASMVLSPLAANQAQASTHHDTSQNLFWPQFESFESKNLRGTLKITGEVTFTRDVTFSEMPTISLVPQSQPETSEEQPASDVFSLKTASMDIDMGAEYQVGDTVSFEAKLNYNADELPYSVQSVDLEFLHGEIAQHLYAKVYFTPYSTVEVWNLDDFDELARRWDYATDNSLRKKLSRRDIPVSDLSVEEFHDESIAKSWQSVEGLAYSIPIKEASRNADVDTTVAASDLQGAKTSSSKCTTKPDDWKLWHGLWTGNVKSQVRNDDWQDIFIDISGLTVEVWEKDDFPGIDDHLATGYTDDDGNLVDALGNPGIPVSTCQRKQGGILNEGDHLEVYFVLIAENQEETIRVRKRLGGTRHIEMHKSQPIAWSYDSNGLAIDMTQDFQLSSIEGEDLKPQLVHWAHQSRKFVEETHVNTGFSFPGSNDPLEFMLTPFGQYTAFMGPGGFKYEIAAALLLIPVLGQIALPLVLLELSNQDTIYLHPDFEKNEDTIFHEFGHYVMWHMQGESWANPFEASFSVHGESFNNPNEKLSWNEGFASGFATIMDVVRFKEDNEATIDGLTHYELRTLGKSNPKHPEDRLKDILHNGNIIEDTQVLTHGYVSELNVASYLYDLWDGANNIDAYSGYAARDEILLDESCGEDTAEFGFEDITKPLRNNQGNGLFSDNDVVSDVNEFTRELRKDLGCWERKSVDEVTKLNRLYALEDEAFYNPTGLSLDTIEAEFTSRFKTFELIDTFIYGANYERLEDNYSTFIDDLNVMDSEEYSFNLITDELVISDGATTYLIDDLTIQNEARLYLNGDLPGGLYNQTPSLIQPMPGSQLVVESCGGEYLVAADGELNLGDEDAGNTAILKQYAGSTTVAESGKLEVNPGSEFEVKDGSFLHLAESSQVVVKGNGKITVENNGYVCIEDGAAIILEDAGSELYFEDGIQIGKPNPDLCSTPSTIDCLDPCDVQISGNGFVTAYNCFDVTIQGDNTIHLNCDTDLTLVTDASNNATYEWSTGETTPTITVSPSTTTTYSVTVTEPNGVFVTEDFTVNVDGTVFCKERFPNDFIH